MNLQIERLESPTREHFYEHYVKKNKPVILTGVTKDWPAMSKWNPEYLKSVAGDAEVTVHFNDQGNFHEWYTNHDRRIDRKISLRELVDKLAGEPADKRYYMTEHNLDLISDQLVEDVDFSKYQIDLDFPLKPCLFMGSDTCMPMHFHAVTEALLCQIYTRKKIWLYSPDQSSLLYMRPWYGTSPVFSQVDCRNPDFDRFP